MSKAKVAAAIAGVLSLAAAVFVVVLFLLKLLWASTVPEVCPGAVATGLVAREISWGAAAKLALFAAVLGGLAKGPDFKVQSGDFKLQSGG